MNNIPKNLILHLRLLGVLIFFAFNTQGWCLNISGTVLGMDGMPAQNRIVMLHQQLPIDHVDFETELSTFTCESDTIGKYIFTNLPTGTYILNILPQTIMEGTTKSPQYIETTVELSSHSISDIVLRPVIISRLNVHGRILSIRDNMPIKAEIAFMPMPPARASREIIINPNLFATVETDGSGTFIKPNLSPGQFSVTLKTPDHPLIGDYFPFELTISEKGEIVIAEDVKTFMATANIQITLWTTMYTPKQAESQGKVNTVSKGPQAPQELHTVSGSGIITHLEVDPDHPANGRVTIQMLERLGQEKEMRQFEATISSNTTASIFQRPNRQSDTDSPYLSLKEWPVKIGRPYSFKISQRGDEYILSSIGFVAKKDIKQVREAYLVCDWLQKEDKKCLNIFEEIQNTKQKLLEYGDLCAAQRNSRTYEKLTEPLRKRNRELYSIYEKLHSNLKQIPPNATVFRGTNPSGSSLGISGTVLDLDGMPVQGQKVALLDNRIQLDSIADTYPLLCQSDPSGHFNFSNLGKGTYDLFIVQPPLEKGQSHMYTVYTTSVISVSSESVSNVELKPILAPRLYVQAEVLSYGTGKPVPSEMEIFPLPASKTTSEIFLNPNLLKPIKSLKSGLLSMPNLSTGDYLCTIYDESRQKSATVVFTVTENDSVKIETKWKVLLGRREIPTRFWTMKWPPLN